MIVVRVELHSAVTGKVTEIARAVIDNVGGTRTSGDYRIRTLRGRNRRDLDLAWLTQAVTRHGRVKGHARLKLHVWHLVAKALAACGYGSADAPPDSDMELELANGEGKLRR